MSQTSAQRVAAYRARQREAGQPDTSRRGSKEYKRTYKRNKAREDRPFAGVDGEGCGTDELGRQLYMLFRMGDRELFTGQRLTTHELLDFICDHPKEEILVGFATGYDVTMILRDLPVSQAKHLLRPKLFVEGHSPFTWYKNFDLQYLPKQYFRVRRVKIERDNEGNERRVVVKGSTRTIYETFGFFQKSFVKVINEFDIGDKATRERIAKDKERRSSFETIGPEERSYCALEVDYLAQTMERLRGYCHGAGIAPASWNGAGKLAGALHRLHETIDAASVVSRVPAGVRDFANMAYYGGRFEITRVGYLKGTVYEYDIRSAYPAAMRELPCLVHGKWVQATPAEIRRHRGLYVAACSFNTPCLPGEARSAKSGGRSPGACQLAGLPVRTKEGHLFWPLQGGGVYWSVEIESAERLGTKVRLHGGWCYVACCDCKPFDWVEPLFDYRRSIGSQGPGYPIKLGINSLYGLLAQRKGRGRFVNMVWAGLITAITRAKLNTFIALAPRDVVMVATDAIYSLKPLDKQLDLGEGLGQWEKTELSELFIVQPGLYWDPSRRPTLWKGKTDKKKSRGLSGKFFEQPGLTESFERSFSHWRDLENSKVVDAPFPSVSVPVPGFTGLKLALARNKPETAGTWTSETREISFDYRNKRQGHHWKGDHIETCVKPGWPGLKSLPHRDFLAGGGAEPWEAARLMLEEQPDWVDMGIPFKD